MNEPIPYRPDGDSAGSFSHPKAEYRKVDTLPQWRIVLHDDEFHEPMDMIELVVNALPITRQAAVRRVLETHHRGTSILMLTHRELAELYYIKLSKQNLIVTLEKE